MHLSDLRAGLKHSVELISADDTYHADALRLALPYPWDNFDLGSLARQDDLSVAALWSMLRPEGRLA